jgi:hypothetical protein
MLFELLHREAKARRSREIQADMEKAEESINSEWMDVIEELQRRIVLDYNATLCDGQNCGGTIISVNDLRRAALRHPEVAFWVEYNRARSGKLRVGERGGLLLSSSSSRNSSHSRSGSFRMGLLSWRSQDQIQNRVIVADEFGLLDFRLKTVQKRDRYKYSLTSLNSFDS